MIERQWRFIQRELLDDRDGGFFASAGSDSALRRLCDLRSKAWRQHKGDIWKDAAHETDSLVATIGFLRGGQQGSGV
jgi:hypothetical protein